MKKITSYGITLALLLMAVACNNGGLKKTKSGLLYKIISDGKGDLVKRGQFMKISYVQKIRDSILYSSADGLPAYVRVDSSGPNYSAAEVFSMVRKGDSAVVIQLADSIQHKSGQPLPPFIKKKDKITLSFRVLDVFPTEDLVKKDREAGLGLMKDKEIKQVTEYLATNSIKAQVTPNGTFVVVNDPGNGPAVDSGKQVSVKYTGKFMPSGKVFETNMSGPRTEPIKFVVGLKGGIIPGWDDGLRLFKKGGKGTLYIPAYLAYDANPGPGNKPFENLIFDVEVVDVVDAPKMNPQTSLQQMMQQHQQQAQGK